jgi:hypothetical protein
VPSPQNISERFANLEKVLSSRQFLNKEGIGNEVPFFIFAHDPELENAVTQERGLLLTRLENQGIRLLHIDLYDLAVEIIEGRGKWDRLLKAEPTMEKDKFKDQLQNLTDVETHLIPSLAKSIDSLPGLQLLVLSGTGMVYPFIRAHTVLNNLQKVAKDYPTLLFFPGRYTHTEGRGQSLDLFGELNEDRYYRALDIEDYKL